MDRRVCGMCGEPLKFCTCHRLPQVSDKNLMRLLGAARAVIDEECCRVNPIGKEPYDPIANPSQFSHEIVELAHVLEDIAND